MCIRDRPEVVGFPVRIAAIKAQAGITVAGDDDVWIRLVVPEKNVVAWREAFDQIVFEQQGLGFGPGNRCLLYTSRCV